MAFAATTTAAILVVVIISASGSSFAQYSPITDGIVEPDRSQTRLMDPTAHTNVTSSSSQQQSIMSPLNQTSSSVSTNATLSTKINEQFYITLSSNPSTGYEWQIASLSNPDVVEFVSSEYIAPASQLLGAEGKQVLTFNSLQEGNVTINLEYVRSWETGIPPASIYVAEVVVVKNGINNNINHFLPRNLLLR
jgi:inhibitor of cysteine peptidase